MASYTCVPATAGTREGGGRCAPAARGAAFQETPSGSVAGLPDVWAKDGENGAPWFGARPARPPTQT